MKNLIIIIVASISFYIGFFFKNESIESSKSHSMGQISYLSAALNEYYMENNKFPPIRYQRKPGEPFHSWRVLLLPYTTTIAAKAYEKYDFSKPWDAPDNVRAIGDICPNFFRADRDPSSYAQYITIGDSDSWPSKWGLNTHIVKKNSDSFIIIELQDSKIIWSSPEY